MKDFLKTRKRNVSHIKKWDEALSWCVFIIEKECGLDIRGDFPLMKFFSLLENLNEHYKKEKAEIDKAKRK